MNDPEVRGSLDFKCVNVLGVGLHAINPETALAGVIHALKFRQKGYICVTGVHGVSEAQSDSVFKTILNNSYLCTPDGMPMVWMGRLAGHTEMRRVYGPDFFLKVFEWSQAKGCKHFFYGGAEGVAEQLMQAMKKRFPDAEIVGYFTPPFRPLNESEEASFLQMVSELKPDILWVGLSTPKQERFMAQFLDRLEVTLMIGVGAAFDFHTGRVSQAPSWIQNFGLEWFYRLCKEPRRLWRRYLKNNPLFLLRICGQFLGMKRYRLNKGS